MKVPGTKVQIRSTTSPSDTAASLNITRDDIRDVNVILSSVFGREGMFHNNMWLNCSGAATKISPSIVGQTEEIARELRSLSIKLTTTPEAIALLDAVFASEYHLRDNRSKYPPFLKQVASLFDPKASAYPVARAFADYQCTYMPLHAISPTVFIPALLSDAIELHRRVDLPNEDLLDVTGGAGLALVDVTSRDDVPSKGVVINALILGGANSSEEFLEDMKNIEKENEYEIATKYPDHLYSSVLALRNREQTMTSHEIVKVVSEIVSNAGIYSLCATIGKAVTGLKDMEWVNFHVLNVQHAAVNSADILMGELSHMVHSTYKYAGNLINTLSTTYLSDFTDKERGPMIALILSRVQSHLEQHGYSKIIVTELVRLSKSFLHSTKLSSEPEEKGGSIVTKVSSTEELMDILSEVFKNKDKASVSSVTVKGTSTSTAGDTNNVVPLVPKKNRLN